MTESAYVRRLLIPFTALLVLIVVGRPATPARAQPADPSPSAAVLLPGEDDGTDTDNDDPEVAPAVSGSGALAPQAGVPVPCPLLTAPVQPSRGGCLPCPVPLPATGIPPNTVAPAVLPPPYDCAQPSIRAVRAGVNLANRVQAESLRSLEVSILRRAFVEPALGDMAGYVDTLLWSGRYADARLLGVRHLDTSVGSRTATTRTIERWDYREYDLDTGRLIYTSYQTVENRWRLVKVGTRWLVSSVEIIPR